MIISTIDASYSGSEGIREAFAKSSEILSDFRMVEEKKIIERLFQQINNNTGLGSYGLNEVLEMLKNNIADTIIVTDDTELYRLEIKCKKCGNITEEIVERVKLIPRKTELKNNSCQSCKSTDSESSQQDLIDYIALIGSQTGAKIEVISGKTEHGIMLASLGKFGAILRYNPHHH